MGLGVINCFMIILAIVAVPLLLRPNSSSNDQGYPNAQGQGLPMQSSAFNRNAAPPVVSTYH